MIGADVEALRRLALQFEQAAGRLRQQAGQVTNGVRASAWLGPVAVRFGTDWDSVHSVKLKAAAEALVRSAADLRKNADQQEAASASLAGKAGSAIGAAAVRSSSPHQRLSPRDYLAFAKAGYGSGDLPAGWSVMTPEEVQALGIDPASLHTKHGLDAMIVKDGSGHYVLVFEGSTTDDGSVDWNRENLRSGLGSGALGGVAGQAAGDVLGAFDPGTSTEEAMNLGYSLKSAVGADNMVITGHSLGGRHAAAASAVSGSEAVTFNAAGLTNDDALYARSLTGNDASFFEYIGGRVTGGNSLRWTLDLDQVTNYSTSGDPLTAVQKLTVAGDAAGRQIVVPGSGHSLDGFDDSLAGKDGGGGW